MILKYELKFYDYWHLSSGLSAGAKADSIVIKDKNALPYAPAKSIKGLVREMAELSGDCDFINRCFGGSSDEKDKCYDKKIKNRQGLCYFTNATLDSETSRQIIQNSLQERLYDTIASTKIGEDGVAVDDSLRGIEVVIPLSLYGEILDISTKDDFDKLLNALKMIKRMGLNRHRGLGRCEFFIIRGEQ